MLNINNLNKLTQESPFLSSLIVSILGSLIGVWGALCIANWSDRKRIKKENNDKRKTYIERLRYFSELIKDSCIQSRNQLAKFQEYSDKIQEYPIEKNLLTVIASCSLDRLKNMDSQELFFTYNTIMAEDKDNAINYKEIYSHIDYISMALQQEISASEKHLYATHEGQLYLKGLIDGIATTIYQYVLQNKFINVSPEHSLLTNYHSIYSTLCEEREPLTQFIIKYIEPLNKDLEKSFSQSTIYHLNDHCISCMLRYSNMKLNSEHHKNQCISVIRNLTEKIRTIEKLNSDIIKQLKSSTMERQIILIQKILCAITMFISLCKFKVRNYLNKRTEMKNQKNKIAILLWIILGIALIMLLLYFSQFNDGFSNKSEDWGYFGSYFSGIAGLLAFFGVLYTLKITSEKGIEDSERGYFFQLIDLHRAKYNEVEIEIESMMKSGADAFKEYTKLTNSYFEHIMLFKYIINNYKDIDKLKELDTKYHNDDKAKTILDLINNISSNLTTMLNKSIVASHYDLIIYLEEALKEHKIPIVNDLDSIIKTIIGKKTLSKKELYDYITLTSGVMYHYHGHILGHYFRNFYYVMKIAKEFQGSSTNDFRKIFRAQISRYEIALGVYNALGPNSSKSLISLLKEYEILKDLYHEDLKPFTYTEDSDIINKILEMHKGEIKEK